MNQWDNLSHYFNTNKNTAEIETGAADNILIAWPSILNGIKMIQNTGENLTVLDYGCGTGGFCDELMSQGYRVTGVDSSSSMISLAEKNLPNIQFYQCEVEDIYTLPGYPYDLVTAIMVIQFIDNVSKFFIHIQKAIKVGGIFAFAVFNQDFVLKNQGIGKDFFGFETSLHPTRGFISFTNEIKLPVFIRTEDEFDSYLNQHGFKRIYMDKPEFSKSFLENYKTNFDTSVSEFLILVYQKIN